MIKTVLKEIPMLLNMEDDPKTYSEAMASRDVAFWKEAINDEMDSILCNNTWALVELPQGSKPIGYAYGVIICLYVDDLLIFGTNLEGIFETKEYLNSRFKMKDLNEIDTVLGIKVKKHNILAAEQNLCTSSGMPLAAAEAAALPDVNTFNAAAMADLMADPDGFDAATFADLSFLDALIGAPDIADDNYNGELFDSNNF
ncbi:hypothetical protein RJ639_024320 [Escallonia herrerae]|uniref:Reverse transcriptase Ty1/copia-type domain-containing protein n=1 Tax=Escallonia herrerae TaxID=1293975 RepID=A0AA89AD68_9ASTE|nr:hypothetical protein RJ639_024320 [Escallonia herrerae]